MADEIVEPQVGAARPNPHLLAYDFYKHMTSLSVLTLGGMLTLSGSVFAEVATERGTFVAMALVAAAGVVAFSAQVELVDWAHRDTARPGLAARWGRWLTALLFGTGVGAFLSGVDRIVL